MDKLGRPVCLKAASIILDSGLVISTANTVTIGIGSHINGIIDKTLVHCRDD